MSTRRASEQEHFGAATPGEAQADEPRHDPDMIDDGATDDAAPAGIVVGLFTSVFNAADLDAIERFVTPDHRYHDPGAAPLPPGPQGVRELAEEYLEAFPDLQFALEEVFEDEDRVAVRWTMRGTHRAEFMGIRPTGRAIELSGLQINRIDRGKVADTWVLTDALGLRERLRGQGAG
jgi:steroid delta-isomerase-like uncharacterized protein